MIQPGKDILPHDGRVVEQTRFIEPASSELNDFRIDVDDVDIDY